MTGSLHDWLLPEVKIELSSDGSADARCDQGFIRVRRLRLRNHYDDGASSQEYAYDVVERAAMDAAVIALYSRRSGTLEVCLRSSLRPPIIFRADYAIPFPRTTSPALWELPAGLIEAGERGEAGVLSCAARETLEETGFNLPPSTFRPLGPPVFLTPGLIAEQVHFVVAEVDPDAAGTPTEDGSAVEERAVIRFFPIDEALEACADGRIADAKTELLLRRLAALEKAP